MFVMSCNEKDPGNHLELVISFTIKQIFQYQILPNILYLFIYYGNPKPNHAR